MPPYLSTLDKQFLKPVLDAFDRVRLTGPGQLNFLFCEIGKIYLDQNGKNYQRLNDIHGALDCASKEFYRRVTVDYENMKIKENGDVF